MVAVGCGVGVADGVGEPVIIGDGVGVAVAVAVAVSSGVGIIHSLIRPRRRVMKPPLLAAMTRPITISNKSMPIQVRFADVRRAITTAAQSVIGGVVRGSAGR